MTRTEKQVFQMTIEIEANMVTNLQNWTCVDVKHRFEPDYHHGCKQTTTEVRNTECTFCCHLTGNVYRLPKLKRKLNFTQVT